MPNRNYIKGKCKEQKLAKSWRDKNTRENFPFIAIRSAGSHSPIDVCVIDLEHHEIMLFQCKAGEFPESEKKKLLEQFKDLNAIFLVRFDVI